MQSATPLVCFGERADEIELEKRHEYQRVLQECFRIECRNYSVVPGMYYEALSLSQRTEFWEYLDGRYLYREAHSTFWLLLMTVSFHDLRALMYSESLTMALPGSHALNVRLLPRGRGENFDVQWFCNP